MFDDPKKNLRWMEDELLAEEEAPEEPGGELEDILQLLDDWDREDSDDLRKVVDVPIRNHANGYGETDQPRNYANGYGARPAAPGNYAVHFDNALYADDAVDDSAAVFEEPEKRKGVGGLWIVFLLELIGILGVILWWLR